MQNKHKQLKPCLVTFYVIQPGNAVDLSSKEKIRKGADKYGRSEKKQMAKHKGHKQANNI